MTSTLGDRSLIVRLIRAVNSSLERHFWRWACLLALLFLASSIAIDLRAKMWTDELFTLYVAKLSGPAAIIKAVAEGADGAPPLYAIVVHSFLAVIKHEALSVRLPATLGYCGMILCLLGFCRRRAPATYSFIASLLACNACFYYSTEGRAYGIVLGCAAGALLCWQTAAEGRRKTLNLTLLALCLGLMIAMHYYAIFFLLPLFLAEIARARKSGKLDWAILAAIAPALLVLWLHYPLIAAGKRFQAHFWSPAHLRMIEPFYNAYLLDPLLYVCLTALIVLAVLHGSPSPQSSYQARMQVEEWVALGVLTVMPPVVVAVSKYTTHVFVDRYVLWAVIGFAVLASIMLSRAARGQVVVGLAILGVLLALSARREIGALRRAPLLREAESVNQALEMLADGPEPVVIPDSHVFMELSYYAAPRLRERLIYPVNRYLDLLYLGYDTDALLLPALSSRMRLHVEEYQGVLAEYSRFILAATPKDYLPWHLVTLGYSVRPIDPAAAQPALFEVEAPTKK